MENYLSKELETAIKLARKAGATILEIYENGFEVEQKQVTANYSEPVTIADKLASRIIVEGLSRAFPNDAILSEEEQDVTEIRLATPRVWIIDPMDGTQDFVDRAGHFAVQIALLEHDELALGVVFQPITDNLYFAVKGQGAFVTEKRGIPQKLQVTRKTEFNEMTLASSRSHRNPKMNRVVEHFAFKDEFPHGSVGLKIALLVRQSADIYIHLSSNTQFWDSAAPEIILKEAGGNLTDLFGKKIDYTLFDVQNHRGILATNGISHEKAVAKIKPLLAEIGIK